MSKANWIYANNVFLNQTYGSQKKALMLFEDTFSKLAAGAQLDRNLSAIHASFRPSYEAYQDLTAKKNKAQNFYEGHTTRFEQQLESISLEVRRWEGAVRAVYVEDSAEERMIFPNKRSPFLAGSYENRLNAIKTLAMSLEDFPVLAQVQADVKNFYDTIALTRQKQQEYEGLNDQLSSDLETQRQATCWVLYGVVGQLMHHYQHQSDKICDFFDLSLLRNTGATGGLALLSGKVKDANGNPVETAIIKLVEGGFEVVTDPNGEFALEVEAGTYTLEVRAAGFMLYSRQNFILERDEEKEVEIEIRKAN